MAAAGTTTNLAVTAGTQTGIANYQWQMNNSNTGGNTNKLWFAPLAFANYSTNYKVIVMDGFLTATSSVVTVTPPPPSIADGQGRSARAGHIAIPVVPPIPARPITNGCSTAPMFPAPTMAGLPRTLTIASMQSTNAGPYQVTVNDGFSSLCLPVHRQP